MHILIVDDVTDNIQVAMNILKEDGYSFSFALVLWCPSGRRISSVKPAMGLAVL